MLVPWIAQRDPTEIPKLVLPEHLGHTDDQHVGWGEPGFITHGTEPVTLGLFKRQCLEFWATARRPEADVSSSVAESPHDVCVFKDQVRQGGRHFRF